MVLMWSNSTSLEIRQEVTFCGSGASALTGAGTGRWLVDDGAEKTFLLNVYLCMG